MQSIFLKRNQNTEMTNNNKKFEKCKKISVTRRIDKNNINWTSRNFIKTDDFTEF